MHFPHKRWRNSKPIKCESHLIWVGVDFWRVVFAFVVRQVDRTVLHRLRVHLGMEDDYDQDEDVDNDNDDDDDDHWYTMTGWRWRLRWKPPSYRWRLQCLSIHPLLCSSLGRLVQFDFSWEFTFPFFQITKSSSFKYFRVPLLENFCFSHQSLLSDVLDFLMFLVYLFQYQPDRCFPTNNRFSSVERRYRRKNWCFGQITEFCVENFFKILKNHRFFQSSGANVTVSGFQPLLSYCHQDVQNHFWSAEMVSESLSDVLSLGTCCFVPILTHH